MRELKRNFPHKAGQFMLVPFILTLLPFSRLLSLLCALPLFSFRSLFFRFFRFTTAATPARRLLNEAFPRGPPFAFLLSRNALHAACKRLFPVARLALVPVVLSRRPISLVSFFS